MNIRNVEINDSDNMLSMMLELDKETEYMLYEDGERSKDSNKLKDRITRSIESGSLFLVAEEGKEIVGFLSADRGMLNRIKHTAYVVVGIRKAYRGKGIGSGFFRGLDSWQ